MSEAIKKVTATISSAFDRVVDITRERLFSPMYFYFLTAWVIINWQFVYTLLFIENDFIWQTQHQTKIVYLTQMYSSEWLFPLLWSSVHLVVAPALTSFVAVWWLTMLSEVFYERYERHQMNKRVIAREIEYKEKVSFFRSQREVREQELENKIKYESNTEYNDQIDASNPGVEVNGIAMTPSEVLYKTDYVAYKTGLDEYESEQADIGEDMAVQAEIDRRRGK